MYDVSHLYRLQSPQFYCFPSIATATTTSSSFPPPPPPPQFYCFPSSSSSILLFSILLLLLLNSIVLNYRHRHHNSLKNCKPVSLFQSAIVSGSKEQPWFSLTVSALSYPSMRVSIQDCHPATSSRISSSFIQCAQGIIPFLEDDRQKLLPYKDALISLAEPKGPYKKKKHILVQEGGGFIQDLLPPVISSLGFLLL